jgi:hypothetical protein
MQNKESVNKLELPLSLFTNLNLSQSHHKHFYDQQADLKELLDAPKLRFTYSDFSHF